MNRSAEYATAIVVAHLMVNIVHGLAHRELHVGLAPLASIFVIAVVLVLPLIATGFLWTAKKRLGLILLSISMFRSTFALTAYLLLIMEAIGTYVGVHFLWIAEESPLQR